MKAGEIQHFDVLKELGVWDELEELKRERRESEKFYSDILELYSCNSPESLIEFVLTNFLDKFIPSTLLFLIEDPLSSTLSTYFYRNLKPAILYKDTEWYHTLKKMLEAQRGPLVFYQIVKQLPLTFAETLKEDYSPEIVFPIRGIGGVYGIILFGSKVLPGSYSSKELLYIERFMLFFSVALQNVLHHYSSITDAKTGLYNHAYFLKRTEEELAKNRRKGKGIGLVLIDIDHFKQFNDTYGHLAGDVVLMEIGRTLKTLVRQEDILSRFGGEEFTLLIPDCKVQTLLEVAERLRTTVERIPILFEGKELHITISVGCVYLPPGLTMNPRTLLAQADAAMYQSKQTGRNRTSIYKGGLLYRGLLHLSLEKSRLT
ncbi:MAG: GGDEF domain-containing protein [Spirochaetales bacterium]